MKKIVTLGEIMLRLSTPGNSRFVQSDSFDVVYGGALRLRLRLRRHYGWFEFSLTFSK